MNVQHNADPAAAFPPHVLREYTFLADGERGILVGPRGDFAWMCAPRWDSDALFSSLIGGAGLYAVFPVDCRSVWGGFYEEGSLIWKSRWITTTGIIECRNALAFPGDPHTAVVLRQIVAVQGAARVGVVLDPRAEFRRKSMKNLAAHRGRLDCPQWFSVIAVVRWSRRQAHPRRCPGRRARSGRGWPSRPGSRGLGPVPRRPTSRSRSSVGRHRSVVGSGGPRAGRHGRGAEMAATPTPCSEASRAPVAAWSPRQPCRYPNGRRRGATTTTGTPGSVTDATSARQWQSPIPTRC